MSGRILFSVKAGAGHIRATVRESGSGVVLSVRDGNLNEAEREMLNGEVVALRDALTVWLKFIGRE